MDQLLGSRKDIVQTLDDLSKECEKEYGDVAWSSETFARVFQSAEKGKLLRGSLVVFSAKEYGYKADRTLHLVAALMELAHTGLLIHDDIMDQDDMRRGEKSLHAQFADEMGRRGHTDPVHIGEALGISGGDALFFMLFQKMSQLSLPHVLIEVFSRELMLCAFGQMNDVAMMEADSEDILRLYKNKTGRYSFALPLMLGGMMAGVSDEQCEKMIAFGQAIGPLFQIADDRIGLTGTLEQIGKPVGSDIKEGKNTLYWQLLLEEASSQDKEKLRGFIGKAPSHQDIEEILYLLEKYSIEEKIKTIEEALVREAKEVVKSLLISDQGKQVLHELIAFVGERKS